MSHYHSIIPDREIKQALTEADQGEVNIISFLPDYDWDSSWIDGDCQVIFTLSNGWKFTVFNDCGVWDYISRVEAPDGRIVNYSNNEDVNSDYSKVIDSMVMRYWYPENPKRWGKNCSVVRKEKYNEMYET